MKKFINVILMMLLGVILSLAWSMVVGVIVMLLWNWLMPAIFNIGTISWLQSVGLMFLMSVTTSRVRYENK